jgi:hypothetical protein
VPSRGSRIPITMLILAAHGLVLWVFWRVRAPVAAEVETFDSILFFVADRPSPAAPAPHPTGRSPAARNAPRAPLVLEPPVDTSTAITLPTPPGAAVDWSAQLARAASATLENERKSREQRGALLHKFHIEDDPRDPHADPRSGFRWYDAGIHRFDTRGALPAWHLNERCVLVAFIFAACALGHIEAHGDLFDGAAARHDESLATHRPNDAP